MQAAAAMSAAEGLDEAAKDAADIAAFFKSGKSAKGRVWIRVGVVVGRAPAAVFCEAWWRKNK